MSALIAWAALREADFSPATIAPPKPEATTGHATADAELWIERVATAGEGLIRRPVAAADAPASDIHFRSEGPLSAAGMQFFLESMDQLYAKDEALLASMIDESTGEDPLREYAEQLGVIERMEENRLQLAAASRGAYVTIGLTNGTVPPHPSGVVSTQTGPVQIADGRLGHIVIWTDVQKHEQLREIRNSLAEVLSHSREEGLWKFNGQPYAERRAWVDRYLDLSARAEEGLGALPPKDLREILAMRKQIEHLRATVDRGQAALIAR